MRSNSRWFFAVAVLVCAAAWLPYWGFRMSTPQYPGESLMLRVSHSGIDGDVHEVETLQQYIGVRFPEHIPELRWLPFSMLGLACLLALAGVAGTGGLGLVVRGTRLALFVAVLHLLAAPVRR